MKARKFSFTTLSFIIIVCVAILFKTSFNQYAEQNTLRAAGLQMSDNRRQTARLDTINMSLNEAENDYRMYTTLWDKAYFVKYTKSIQHVSSLLKSFSEENKVRNATENISVDLVKKNKQILLYAKLKKLTDSLLLINLHADSLKSNNPVKAIQPLRLPQHVVKKTTHVEEIKPEAPEKKAKLFQRLKSAILNKDNKKDTIKIHDKETVYQNTDSKELLYNKKQLEAIKNYYKNLFEKQQQNRISLGEKEKIILTLNQQILDNIKLIFHEFSLREYQIAENRETDLRNKSVNALDVIDRSGKIHLIVNLISLAIIAFLLVKLYYAYNRILKAKKAAEEQVIVKSRFFTSLSHEMRTPLNAILGLTEQLKATPLNKEQQTMSILLETSSSMLLSAVNEVLDFSRLETGKLTLSKTPFYFKTVIGGIVGTTTILANQKGLTLTLNQERVPDLLLMGDPYRLKQIFMNLLANAIKFTDEGEITVDIDLQQVDSDNIVLLIKITDTGIGIAEKELPLIFDEFSQVVHHKRNDWQKGSGLGLPICKKLVQLHNGTIEVSSTVNKGTIFTIELPYAIAPYDTEEEPLKSNIFLQTDSFNDIHLLVVDDAEMNLMVIEMILNKSGISFRTAKNGKEALKHFNDHDFDMVLTDIEMPEMDGIELSKNIRMHSDIKKATIPIIVITGHISPEAHENYITIGINDYLVKPFNEKELTEKILDYLN